MHPPHISFSPQSKGHAVGGVRLISDSKVPTGVSASMNGCLPLCVGPGPGVPCLSIRKLSKYHKANDSALPYHDGKQCVFIIFLTIS